MCEWSQVILRILLSRPRSTLGVAAPFVFVIAFLLVLDPLRQRRFPPRSQTEFGNEEATAEGPRPIKGASTKNEKEPACLRNVSRLL